MTDNLEKDIRQLFSNAGLNAGLNRDEVALLLLDLLYRIQELEAKLREQT
jgi:hypothetical protein